MEIDLNTIIIGVAGLAIALIQWLGKGKIKTIETGIEKLAQSISSLSKAFTDYKEQALKDCSDKRQGIYNEVYKKDYVDTIKEDVKDVKGDVNKLEGRFNNITNGFKVPKE